MINIFQPALGEDELAAVRDVFQSNWIGMGQYVDEFCKAFATHLNRSPNHFLATTSCSEGIFLSAYLFGFDSSSEIIAPAISFVAVGNTIISSGARLVLCDVDRFTCNATAKFIAEKITSKTKAVILNHYGGVPCNMDPIIELCKAHDIVVIEDSACAIKSYYKGRACGTIGDMGVWSFGPTKTICTGDGGMIYLKAEDQIPVARERLYHGLPARKNSGTDSASSGDKQWWEIRINRFGLRATMNNIAGALGVVQLTKLNDFIERRRAIFDLYSSELSHLDWLRLPPKLKEECSSSYYFFHVQLTKRDELAAFLLDNGIYSTFRYWPLHKIKAFGIRGANLPNSEYISQHTLNLPLHQSLTDAEVGRVIDAVKRFGKLRY